MHRVSWPILILALVSCTQFPDLDERITPELRAQKPPAFLPISEFAKNDQAAVDQTFDAVNARIARLNERAARLRGPVFAPSDRVRLSQQPML